MRIVVSFVDSMWGEPWHQDGSPHFVFDPGALDHSFPFRTALGTMADNNGAGWMVGPVPDS